VSALAYPADWPAPAGVEGWQTVRSGGVSTGAYSSLNLALHVGDRAEAVARNRERLRSRLGLPADPVWLDQVHGNRVLRIDRGESGPADAAITSMAGTVLAVMTADCLPVLLASRDGSVVGVAHAGWRGLASGVIGATVAAFERDPAELLAWLGPSISADASEVGDEVRSAFVASEPEAAAAFQPNARGRWQADLGWLARAALARAGVADVFGAPMCTSKSERRYFSHRRESPCGRMASLIWRGRKIEGRR
jgi:YfiH family protein